MLSKKIIWCVAALSLGASAMAGEAALPANPTVNQLVAYAFAHSPQVTAAREEWRSKIESIRVAGGPPDPEIMFEQMGFTDPEWQVRVSAMVPFPGKLGAAESAAGGDAEIARFELDRTYRDLAGSVREGAAEVAYLQRALKIAAANEKLLGRLNGLAESSFAANRAELADLIRAKAEVAKVAYDSAVLAELLAVEKEKLNALLAREPLAELGEIALPAPAALLWSPEEAVALAAKNPEEIKSATAEVEKMNSEARMARLEWLPDFTLEAFKNPIDGPTDSYGVAVGFTLPIWVGKNSGRVAAAEAQVKRAEAMREMRRLDMKSQARELYFRTTNAQKLAHLYRETLIPQTRRSLELAETWAQGNETGLVGYAEVMTTLYGFELALARAEADHAKYLARIERLAGRPLTTREGQEKEAAK